MRLTCILLVATLATVGRFGAAAAEENPTKFIAALRDNGYADIAVEYLTDLKESKKLPADLADVWDLEISKCLRSASKQAYSKAEADRDMADAQEHINKFLKEKPNHPEAVSALVSWAGFATDKAVEQLRLSKDSRVSKEKQAEHLAAAQAAFEEARPKFAEAAENFKKMLTKAKSKASREEITGKWQDARFQAILCDYYIADTYADRKDPKRKEILEKASKEFDEVYQLSRDGLAGLYPHMWQGKCAMELGDDELAMDIFDEVIVRLPDPNDRTRIAPEIEALLSQVQRFRLELIAKKSPKQFVAEAKTFRLNYRRLKQTDGYQEISLQLVKTLLAEAEKASGAEKSKLSGDAKSILAEMIRVPSGVQPDAIQLRQKLLGDSGAAGGTFDEEVTLGDLSLNDKKYDDAITHYKHAMELYDKMPETTQRKNEKQAKAVVGVLAQTYYAIAHEQFSKGKLTDCLNTLKILIVKPAEGPDYRDSAAAPLGAFLAVTTMLNQYLAITEPDQEAERTAALNRVIKMADYATHTWPDKPETDDIRMTLGQAYLVSHQVDRALKQFDTVNPKSDRYPTAMHLEGRTYWTRYLMAKQKPESQRDPKAMAADREKAVQAIATSVELQRKLPAPDQRAQAALVETQLLLADMTLEGGDGKGAAALYQPLVDTIKKTKPESLDPTMLRIFLGDVRSYLLAGDLTKAGEAGMVLMELGPDNEMVNRQLLDFAKLLDVERKKAEAIGTAAVGAADTQAAADRVAAMQEILGKLLKKLATREKFSAAGMVWTAETCSTIGLDEAAEQQCQGFLKRVKDDADFAAKGGKQGETRVRTLLIRIESNQGKFDAAEKEVEDLIKRNPRALEPKLLQCHILEAWGAKVPAKFAEAVTAWDTLRRSMERMPRDRRGNRPTEYFEAAYSEALCLYTDAKKLDKQGDKPGAADMAKKAQQVLKSILFQNSKMSDVAMKAKYEKLIDQAEILQGRKPESFKNPAAKGK